MTGIVKKADCSRLLFGIKAGCSLFRSIFIITAQQWDPSKQEVTRKHPQYRQYNNHIRSVLANVEDVILELTREGILGGLTAKQLKRIF